MSYNRPILAISDYIRNRTILDNCILIVNAYLLKTKHIPSPIKSDSYPILFIDFKNDSIKLLKGEKK